MSPPRFPQSSVMLPLLSLLALLCAPLAAAQAIAEPPGQSILFGFWANPYETGTSPAPVDVNQVLGLNVPLFQMSQYIPLAPVDPTTGIGGAIRSDLIDATNTTAAVFLTVYPVGGFDNVTQADLDALAQQIVQLQGTNNRTVFLRYAPEMQGYWWLYGNQPTAFLQNWKTMYSTVKAAAPSTAIVWSPNTGQGYPWGQSLPNSTDPNQAADIALLDTNGDGTLDSGDNAYSPYWPGPEYVDWMGLSLYYNGPNGEPGNVPESGGYCASVFDGVNPIGGATMANFYTTYCANYTDKACMISECGTGYHPDLSGDSDVQMKQAWINDCIANTTFLDSHPRIKAITQFEFEKIENSDDLQDHRFTNNSAVAQVLVQALGSMSQYFSWATPINATSTNSTNSTASASSSSSSSGGAPDPTTGVTSAASARFDVRPPALLITMFLGLVGLSWRG